MPADARAPRSTGIVVLATLAVIAALYFGRVFLVPIALSILFTGLLRPIVRQFERARLPTPVGALVVLLVFLGVLAGAVLVACGSSTVEVWPASVELANVSPDKMSVALKNCSSQAT